MSANLRIKDIYDLSPGPLHQPGDIWHSLPTFGILSAEFAPAIIITPACDLANNKTDTVTYIPIIPAASYFTLPVNITEIIQTINNNLAICKIKLSLKNEISSHSLPSHESIEEALSCVVMIAKKSQNNNTEIAIEKLLAGLEILQAISNNNNILPGITGKCASIAIKGWKDRIEKKIIRNATSDTYFLPYDEQPHEWSAIPSHSVALFRYPLSIPLEFLNLANNSSIDWEQSLNSLEKVYPVAKFFDKIRPMKRGSLRASFSSDLLTKYVGLYVRLGSPDYSDEMILRFRNEIEV